MPFGKVKIWEEKKGCGVIIPNHGGGELLFHKNELPVGHTISIGQILKYDLGRDRQGRVAAVNINNSRTSNGDSSGGAVGNPNKKWWEFWK